MDATQIIDDSILESDEEEKEEEDENKRGKPLAKLRVLKNQHISETELPLYLGENLLGRDPTTCSLPLVAGSVSKQHTVISISAIRSRSRRGEVALEALVWDLGSMNGTRRGRFKLTPHVRYALNEGDCLVVADIPCQYVSCGVDKMTVQRDIGSPLNRNVERRTGEDGSKGNSQVRGSSGPQGLGCNTKAGSEKHVNGPVAVTSPMASSSSTEKIGETPVRTKSLSFEQTPTQPQGILVPESDSDSDGDQGSRRDRRVKAVVSDSDSHMSSPACSTFLSPTNKVIPESEDESPITPCSSLTKNRPKKHVSLSQEHRDVDLGRRQLKSKTARATVDDSNDEGEEVKEERAARGGGGGGEGGGEESAERTTSGSPTAGDGLSASTSAVAGNAVPPLNLDSDTDVEGEDGVAAVALPLNAPPAAPQTNPPPEPDRFHLDSDTDVDEEEEGEEGVSDRGPQPVVASSDPNKATGSIPVIHATELSLDSTTDRNGASLSQTASSTKPTAADSAPSTQSKGFFLDSDTDAEEGENQVRTEHTNSKSDITHSSVDPNASRAADLTAVSQKLHLDSDTDDEVITVQTPACQPTGTAADMGPPSPAGPGADLEILSDSDTDQEEKEGGPQLLPATGAAANAAADASVAAGPVAMAAAADSGSDADTDVEESPVPPAGKTADPTKDFKLDSDTDVEEEEAGSDEEGDGLTTGSSGVKARGLRLGLASSLPTCSTPVGLSGRVEELETQAFFHLPGSLRCPDPPTLGPVLSSSDSQEDNDFVVAETQSFVLESRHHPGTHPEDPAVAPTQAFCVEASSSGDEQEDESSIGHLQAGTLAFANTQAFASMVQDGALEATLAYGTLPTRASSASDDSELEATQAYEGNKEAGFTLEATQAYLPGPQIDAKPEGEERTSMATAETLDMSAYAEAEQETQPFHFPTAHSVTTAETQLMSTFAEEDDRGQDLAGARPPSQVRQAKSRKQTEDGEATQSEEAPMDLALAETQPKVSSDDEDSVPLPRKRRAKSRRLADEETPSLSLSEISTAETQPMLTHDDDDDKDDRTVAKPQRKRRGQRQRVEDEDTQPHVTSANICTMETQPFAAVEIDSEEENEETKASYRKAKGRPRRGKGRASEAGGSGVNGRTRTGQQKGETEKEQEAPEPTRRQTRGRRAQVNAKEEEVESKAEETPQVRRGGRQKTTKQQKGGREEEREQAREQEDEERNERVDEDGPRRGREDAERAAKEQEERDRAERELREQQEREKLEMERREKEERERAEREKERLEEQERLERERKEKEEQEQLEQEKREQEERERLEREKAEREEKERLEKERMEREEREREEKERIEMEEKERLEREEKDRIERERQELEEKERLKREQAEREEKERLEREEKERIEREEKEKLEREEKERIEREEKEKLEREEKERIEREEKEKLEREEKERIERERKEQEENERLEREQAEREEKERLEREEKERIEREKERLEQEEKERIEREEKERLEREEKERIEREEKERLEREEKERIERERRELEERERLERLQKEREEQERKERERKAAEERARQEREMEEREEKERLEREESERIERERKEQEVKELLEREQAEREETERLEREKERLEKTRTEKEKHDKHEAEKKERDRLESDGAERKEVEKERQEREEEKQQLQKKAVENRAREQREAEDQEDKEGVKVTTSGRGRRGRRTIAAHPEPDANLLSTDDILARKTRSRSNSSTSVGSETSASSVGVRGRRGRGRDSQKDSQPARESNTRTSRRTIAAISSADRDPTGQGAGSVDSQTSQNAGIGGGDRARGRGRKKKGPEPVVDAAPSNDQTSAPKPPAKGQKSTRTEESPADASQADGEGKVGSQQASTTRGRGRAKADDPQPSAVNEDDHTSQAEESHTKDQVIPQSSVKGRCRSQKAAQVGTAASLGMSTDSQTNTTKEDEVRRRGKRIKSEQPEEEVAQEEESTGPKLAKVTSKPQRGRRLKAVKAEQEAEDEDGDRLAPVAAIKANAASAQGTRNTKQVTGETEDENEKVEEEAVERKVRGRQSAARKKKEAEKEDALPVSNTMDLCVGVESKAPRTPTGNASRKRTAPLDCSPVAKAPRSSSASPGTLSRLRASAQAYKVLFTGVVDEAGERVVSRLGGSMAKGVVDMTYLVTDKVRRTVKFLCAVARGVPIVSTHWLEKCGKAGSFLPANAFIVKDDEQEKKFSFCLQESLRTASNQPLLQGYEIHVTKSVKPEPLHMKEIISCSGASFLPRMPSAHKAQTVVISCEEDWSLCGPAVAASLPVVTAEFILAGILQQRIDLEAHALQAPAPPSNSQTSGSRARGRKKP